MSVDLIHLLDHLGSPRILVIGDLMLDRYIWGDAARISQEAPVLLLQADRREERLGGASSVAMMLRALGADVCLAGVTGADGDSERIRRMLSELSVDHSAIVTDASRPSTVKERYIGRAQHKHPQQILRVDYETRAAINRGIEDRLLQAIADIIPTCAAILISDYDKGVCTQRVLAATIAEARRLGKKVLVDPIRGGDYAKYRGCSAITPNRLEAGLAVDLEITNNSLALVAGERLLQSLNLEASIITLDKEGMALVDHIGARSVFATRPRQVYDITGAGDMVLSVLGLALAAGTDYPTAIRLANVAGGLEVEKIGVATVTREEIRTDLWKAEALIRSQDNKLVPIEALLKEIEIHRRMGQKVAFTNGCFDVLHAGHVQYLEEARAQADLLVVGLNSDASIRKLKGPNRPINPLTARAVVLNGLRSVDLITVFDAATPIELIQQIRPDVLVKGADYRKEAVAGASFVESYGGRVHLAAVREGFSTTNLLSRLEAA